MNSVMGVFNLIISLWRHHLVREIPRLSYRGEVVCDPILEIDYTADGAWKMDEKGVIKTVGGMYR